MQQLTSVTPALTTFLIHGVANVGKTATLASAAAFEAQHGPVTYINILGEPYNTLASFPLEKANVVIAETIDDVHTIMKQSGRQRLTLIDSLSALNELADLKETGGLRAPGGGRGGESTGGQAEWGRIKFHIQSAIEAVKRSSDMVIACVHSDRKEDNVTHERYISTDLVGKLAIRICQRFDFVGYLELETLTPKRVVRRLSFHPRIDALTRCNTRKQMTAPITLPESVIEVWPAIVDALTKTL